MACNSVSKETQPEELASSSAGLLSSVLTEDSTHLHCCRLNHVGQLAEHSGIRSCTVVILGCNFNVFILGSQTIQKYVVNSKHLALTLLCSHVFLSSLLLCLCSAPQRTLTLGFSFPGLCPHVSLALPILLPLLSSPFH